MRLILLAAGVFMLLQSSVTAQTAVKQYTIEQFFKTVSYGGGSFNKQENRILVHDNSTGIFNLYEIDLATRKKTAITRSEKESIFQIDYVPGTRDILYSSDQGGNENSHIYLRKADGSVQDLTPGEKEKAQFLQWNKSKTAFFFLSNARDLRFFDLYRMDISNWRRELVYLNDDGFLVGNISPDENHILMVKPVTTDQNELYLYNRNNEMLKKISSDGEASYSPQGFDRDNSAFYYTTNDGDEFSYLVKYNMANDERKKIFSAGWDVMYMYLSENGRFRVIGINEDGRNSVRLFDHKTGKEIPFPRVSEGFVNGVRISPSEKKMILYLYSDRTPVNLWSYSFETKKLERLTHAMNPEINPADLVDAEIIRFTSFDGQEIPAIYYKPKNASPANKVPALIWVHGGPGGQSRAGYSSAIQYFVNHGYAILAVNNRGSSGYGKTFYKMDNRDHGNADLRDCVGGKKWLEQQEDIDGERIGIYGGSYGGFMALAGIIQYPEEFRVGVNLFGVTNWLRTLRSIPPYWESFRKALYEEMGDPDEDSVRLYNISPLFNADKIRTPLLVLQGANDPRVLQVESDEIVESARANGVPVEYVLFPDEGHGFLKKENQMTAARVTLAFLDKFLKKPGEGTRRGF